MIHKFIAISASLLISTLILCVPQSSAQNNHQAHRSKKPGRYLIDLSRIRNAVLNLEPPKREPMSSSPIKVNYDSLLSQGLPNKSQALASADSSTKVNIIKPLRIDPAKLFSGQQFRSQILGNERGTIRQTALEFQNNNKAVKR